MKADKNLEARGLACIDLTPKVKIALSEIQSGQVLEVLSDDSSAREGIPAWCRLTGHSLINSEKINTDETLFYIQKK